MKKKILVVDDEKDIVEILEYNLKNEGYDVVTAYNGRQAIEKIDKNTDLVLMDVMMPELDGIETFKRIKEIPSLARIPIVFLTAKNAEVDEIMALEIGADDYLIKPCSIRKIMAKIKSIISRDPKKTTEQEKDILKINNIEVIPDSYSVKTGKGLTRLPKKEFETLYFLIKNKGKIVTREKLLSSIWGEDVYVGTRTIDVHIRKIREKLGSASDMIETIKGVGYKVIG